MPANKTPQQTHKNIPPRAKSDDPDERPRVELAPLIRRCIHCWMLDSANTLQPSIQVAFSQGKNEGVEDAANPEPIRFTAIVDISAPVAELLGQSVSVPVSAIPAQLEAELPQIFNAAELYTIKHTLMTINAYRVEREVKDGQSSLEYSQSEQLRWQKSYESQKRLYEITLERIEEKLLEKERIATYNDDDPRARRGNWGQSSGIRVIAGTSAAGGVRPCPEYHDQPYIGLKTIPWFWDGSKTGKTKLAKRRQAVRFAPDIKIIASR